MYIAGILPAARERLATTPYDAPLIDAAKLLSRAEVNLVVVCDSSNALAGVITRTDVVRRISHCAGNSCTTGVSAVMTGRFVSYTRGTHSRCSSAKSNLRSFCCATT